MKAMPKAPRPDTRRVLVVEDHPMTRAGLEQLINGEEDLRVAWSAENAAAALRVVMSETPDVILTDITLPDKNGLELIKDIKAVRKDVPILVISMHEESLYAERSLRAGARGYITKHEGGERLMNAIRTVLAGGIYVSEKTGASILEIFAGHSRAAASSPMSQLTDREFEVFQLFGEGKGTKEIADRLHVSEKTVAVHRVHIKEKLQLGSAGELIHHAIRWVEAQRPAGPN